MAVIDYEFKINKESKEDLKFVTQVIRLLNNIDIVGTSGISFDAKPEVAFTVRDNIFTVRYTIPSKKELIIKSKEEQNV